MRVFGLCVYFFFFFFNDTATTEIYTLSLHDALPIYRRQRGSGARGGRGAGSGAEPADARSLPGDRGSEPEAIERSEEHTSELQSRLHLVCRLLLEKKKKRRCCLAANYTIPHQPSVRH